VGASKGTRERKREGGRKRERKGEKCKSVKVRQAVAVVGKEGEKEKHARSSVPGFVNVILF